MDNDQALFIRGGKLSCVDVEAFLDDYIDGEMGRSLGKRFEDHLQDCESCRNLVTETQHIVSMAKTLANTPLPEDVRLRLRKALRERTGHEFNDFSPERIVAKTKRVL